MHVLFGVLLVTILGIGKKAVPHVVGGGAWPNEPVGNVVVLDYACSAEVPVTADGAFAPDWSGILNPNTRLTRFDDATAPNTPTSVWQHHYPTGMAGGNAGATVYKVLTPNRKKVYCGLWFKISDPFQSHASGVQKLVFLFTDTAGKDVAYGPYGLVPSLRMRVVTQYAAESRLLVGNVQADLVTLGVWHQTEWLHEYSDPGVANGVMKWWLDGVLQGSYTDIENDTDEGFDTFKWSPGWGGAGDTKTQDDNIWVDDFRLSYTP